MADFRQYSADKADNQKSVVYKYVKTREIEILQRTSFSLELITTERSTNAHFKLASQISGLGRSSGGLPSKEQQVPLLSLLPNII